MSNYTTQEQKLLLALAREAIGAGTENRRLRLNLNEYPERLIKQRACFVTLLKTGSLRGCIGTLEPWRSLVEDVAENAYAAAFNDSRFPSVEVGELDLLEYHISVLSVPRPMEIASESDLVRQLQPGKDGLILSLGRHRGTFLPSVWESLADPEDFVRQLKRKAGLDENFWSDEIRVERYSTESIY